MLKKIISTIAFILLSTNLFAQSSGTPRTLRVRIDANGYLVLSAAAQTNPVTTSVFGNARLKTDASGNLLVVLTGGSGAPSNGQYIIFTANAALTGAQNVGLLTTGLLLNSVAAGSATLSQYAGTSCTNQFPRSLNNSGAATCASVAIGSDVSGLGTGIATALGVNTGSAGAPVLFNGALGTPTSGTATNLTGYAFPITVTGVTSGGVLYNSDTTHVATSALLGSTQLVIGGGAGAAPLTDSNWTIEQTNHILTTSTQPRATVRNSSGQSITNASETPLTFDTNTDAVPASIHSTSSNTSRLVAPLAGYYCISYTFGFTASAFIQYSYIRKNNTTVIGSAVNVLGNVTTPITQSQTTCMTLATNDYLEVIVNQQSAAPLAISASFLPNVNFWKQF